MRLVAAAFKRTALQSSPALLSRGFWRSLLCVTATALAVAAAFLAAPTVAQSDEIEYPRWDGRYRYETAGGPHTTFFNSTSALIVKGYSDPNASGDGFKWKAIGVKTSPVAGTIQVGTAQRYTNVFLGHTFRTPSAGTLYLNCAAMGGDPGSDINGGTAWAYREEEGPATGLGNGFSEIDFEADSLVTILAFSWNASTSSTRTHATVSFSFDQPLPGSSWWDRIDYYIKDVIHGGKPKSDHPVLGNGSRAEIVPHSSSHTATSIAFVSVPVTGAYGRDAPLHFGNASVAALAAPPEDDASGASAVAYGFVTADPDVLNFAKLHLPEHLPGGMASLDLLFGDTTVALAAGAVFDFTEYVPGGVSAFSLGGIDPVLGLDPNDSPAIPIGLQFTGNGLAEFYALTYSPVPEPSALAMLAAASVGLAGYVARKRTSHRASMR